LRAKAIKELCNISEACKQKVKVNIRGMAVIDPEDWTVPSDRHCCWTCSVRHTREHYKLQLCSSYV